MQSSWFAFGGEASQDASPMTQGLFWVCPTPTGVGVYVRLPAPAGDGTRTYSANPSAERGSAPNQSQQLMRQSVDGPRDF